MKILLIGLLLLSNVVFGQNFPGKDVELLLNKELRVLPKHPSLQKFGYEHFYINDKFDGSIINKENNVYECCEMFNSKYLRLVGKIFKVLSLEPYKDDIGQDKFKLKMQSDSAGIIYFDYNPKYDFQFPFEVIGGLNAPEGFYCQGIKNKTDKFTGETQYDTEMIDGITFQKSGNKIYLYCVSSGPTVNVNKKGLIFLLQNNKRINRPEATIDVKVVEDFFAYSAFIELSNDEIELLSENNITDERLYIYDREIKDGTKLRAYLKCLAKR